MVSFPLPLPPFCLFSFALISFIFLPHNNHFILIFYLHIHSFLFLAVTDINYERFTTKTTLMFKKGWKETKRLNEEIKDRKKGKRDIKGKLLRNKVKGRRWNYLLFKAFAEIIKRESNAVRKFWIFLKTFSHFQDFCSLVFYFTIFHRLIFNNYSTKISNSFPLHFTIKIAQNKNFYILYAFIFFSF